jgi:hypothetical protein
MVHTTVKDLVFLLILIVVVIRVNLAALRNCGTYNSFPMTSLRVSSKHEPLSSSSQPSSPVEEEDLGKPNNTEDDGSTSTLVPSKRKGKERAPVVADDEDDEDDSETIIEETVQHVPSRYPPLDEEAIETRRIEEVSLGVWEVMHISYYVWFGLEFAASLGGRARSKEKNT